MSEARKIACLVGTDLTKHMNLTRIQICRPLNIMHTGKSDCPCEPHVFSHGADPELLKKAVDEHNEFDWRPRNGNYALSFNSG